MLVERLGASSDQADRHIVESAINAAGKDISLRPHLPTVAACDSQKRSLCGTIRTLPNPRLARWNTNTTGPRPIVNWRELHNPTL